MGMFDFLEKKKGPKFAVKEENEQEKSKAEAKEKALEKFKNKIAHQKSVEIKKYHKSAKEIAGVSARKKDLGVCIPEHAKGKDAFSFNSTVDKDVCIPDHAKSPQEKKRSKLIPQSNPFEKLYNAGKKDNAEFERELEEITSQNPQEPFDIEPELGVEQVGGTAKTQSSLRKVSNAMQKRASVSFEGEGAPETVEEKLAKLAERKAALAAEVRSVMGMRGAASENQKKQQPKISYNPRLSPAVNEADEAEELDEIDASIEKVNSYTPKFSNIARKKFEASRREEPEAKGFGSFNVTGVYPGGDTTIVSGSVRSGKIRAGMSAQSKGATIRVNEVKRGMEKVNELYEGEEGTIFVRGTVNTIKFGDLLDFS